MRIFLRKNEFCKCVISQCSNCFLFLSMWILLGEKNTFYSKSNQFFMLPLQIVDIVNIVFGFLLLLLIVYKLELVNETDIRFSSSNRKSAFFQKHSFKLDVFNWLTALLAQRFVCNNCSWWRFFIISVRHFQFWWHFTQWKKSIFNLLNAILLQINETSI